MSTAALLKGVETRLRSSAVLNDPNGKICGIQPDGRPPVNSGQWFYAIHPLGVTSADPNSLSHDRAHAIGVTLTARMAYAPQDRRGNRLTLASELLERAEAIADALHQDDLHRIEANKLIPGSEEYVAINSGIATVNGFVEPLRLMMIGPPIEMGPEWAGETGGDEDTGDDKNLLTIQVSFGDAKRVRPLS